MNLTEERLQYLELLSQKFPSPAQVSTEIINLNAILGLPKGSEHFISDIHGEYRLFLHILKNASGSVRRKIFQCFTEEEMPPAEVDALATLIYYPEEKLALLKEENGPLSTEWYTATLLHLVQVIRHVDGALGALLHAHAHVLRAHHGARLRIHELDGELAALCRRCIGVECHAAHLLALHLGLAEVYLQAVELAGHGHYHLSAEHAAWLAAVVHAHGQHVLLAPVHGHLLGVHHV